MADQRQRNVQRGEICRDGANRHIPDPGASLWQNWRSFEVIVANSGWLYAMDLSSPIANCPRVTSEVLALRFGRPDQGHFLLFSLVHNLAYVGSAHSRFPKYTVKIIGDTFQNMANKRFMIFYLIKVK